jgi:hypothetical protein
MRLVGSATHLGGIARALERAERGGAQPAAVLSWD